MAVTVETLRGELEEAFRNRAHLYRILLCWIRLSRRGPRGSAGAPST
jgi:hypothetical protein